MSKKEDKSTHPIALGIGSQITSKTIRVVPSGFGLSPLRWSAALAITAMKPSEEGAKEMVSHLVEIPWPMAKALNEMLATAIEGYEAKEGEIAIPESFYRTPPSDENQ